MIIKVDGCSSWTTGNWPILLETVTKYKGSDHMYRIEHNHQWM